MTGENWNKTYPNDDYFTRTNFDKDELRINQRQSVLTEMELLKKGPTWALTKADLLSDLERILKSGES